MTFDVLVSLSSRKKIQSQRNGFFFHGSYTVLMNASQNFVVLRITSSFSITQNFEIVSSENEDNRSKNQVTAETTTYRRCDQDTSTKIETRWGGVRVEFRSAHRVFVSKRQDESCDDVRIFFKIFTLAQIFHTLDIQPTYICIYEVALYHSLLTHESTSPFKLLRILT